MWRLFCVSMKCYDYIIVGAGLFGCTFAWYARQKGNRVLLIDRRSDIGGNLFCESVEGINVHKYGAHIFHTSNKNVWDFVNGFVEFNRYTNCPLANYKGELYNLPFNMNTFHALWGVSSPEEAITIIQRQQTEAVGAIAVARNLEEQAISLVGSEIYQKLIKGYTEKQWGRPCRELPSFIIKRLPLRWVFDNNYFNDRYQGIPEGGYNILISRLIEGCDIETSTDYLKDREAWDRMARKKIVFTGQIDEFYNYCFGPLEYRSVDFETEILDMPNYQGNAVVNYTDEETPYTRIIEHKHFEMFGDRVYDNPHTVISREYSAEWKPGMEPFYPVNNEYNNNLYERYKKLASNEEKIIFGGRLAEYRYYDMDKVIEQAMDVAKKYL